MPFDFNNYEAFGKSLLENGTDEVHFRNSVSRGYYSFFHKVKKILGYSDKTVINHIDLINELRSDRRLKGGAKLSNFMKTCKTHREAADYYMEPKESHISFKNNRFCQQFWVGYDEFVRILNQEQIQKEE